MEKILELQARLKAPKNQYNVFGKYHYRNCEDIVEAVKPIALELGLLLNITDEVFEVKDRIYIKATATIINIKNGLKISSTAYAREPESLKGMSESQVTGATSSYARKYALNGLLAIDDTKDSDSEEFTKITNLFITNEQIEEIKHLINLTNTDIAQFLKFYKIENLEQMDATIYTNAKKHLTKKVKV